MFVNGWRAAPLVVVMGVDKAEGGNLLAEEVDSLTQERVKGWKYDNLFAIKIFWIKFVYINNS